MKGKPEEHVTKEDLLQPLSREYLLEQGSCCGSGCRNCPYVDEFGNRHQAGETRITPSEE